MRCSTDPVFKQTIEQITQSDQFSAKMAGGNGKCRYGDDDHGACDADEGTGDAANHVCDAGGEAQEPCA